jgi:hypothetical protein
MADLNALIAQGAQFAAPVDPFAQYGKMQQLEQGQTANQLNRMKMDEYQRGLQEEGGLRNFLSGKTDLTKPENRAGLLQYGKTGRDYLKTLSEQDAAQAMQQKAQVELLGNKLKLLPDAYKMADTPEAYIDLHKSIHADPVLGPWLKSTGATQERGFAQIQDAIKNGTFDKLRMGSMQSVAQVLDSMKPVKGSNVAQLIAERNALLPNDPNRKIYDDAIQKESQFAPRAITNVNVPPQEKAERAERGKLLVTEYSDISKAARLAAKTLPSIDANLSILNKGFSTGFGTETIAAGASVLSALGVPNAEKFATNAQVFQAKATEAVLQKQLEQKGPQTESDAQRIDQIGAQLGKTTAGNKFVLTAAKEQLKRDMEQRNFYDTWWKTNKTYDGAEDAWYSGEGGKSLFDRPALKEYIKTTEAPAANRPSLDSIFKSPPAAGAKGK